MTSNESRRQLERDSFSKEQKNEIEYIEINDRKAELKFANIEDKGVLQFISNYKREDDEGWSHFCRYLGSQFVDTNVSMFANCMKKLVLIWNSKFNFHIYRYIKNFQDILLIRFPILDRIIKMLETLINKFGKSVIEFGDYGMNYSLINEYLLTECAEIIEELIQKLRNPYDWRTEEIHLINTFQLILNKITKECHYEFLKNFFQIVILDYLYYENNDQKSFNSKGEDEFGEFQKKLLLGHLSDYFGCSVGIHGENAESMKSIMHEKLGLFTENCLNPFNGFESKFMRIYKNGKEKKVIADSQLLYQIYFAFDDLKLLSFFILILIKILVKSYVSRKILFPLNEFELLNMDSENTNFIKLIITKRISLSFIFGLYYVFENRFDPEKF